MAGGCNGQRRSLSFYPSPISEIRRAEVGVGPAQYDRRMPGAHWPLGVLGVSLAVTAVVVLASLPEPAPPDESRGDLATRAAGRPWHVKGGAVGDGSPARPFGRLAEALAVAGPGDEVLIAPGTYREPLRTTRGGTAEAPLVIRAAQAENRPVFEVTGRVATISHPHIVVDGLVLDGQYGKDDAVRVSSAATGLVLRRVEVRRSSRDCIDMAAPSDVTIDQILIHHCLDAANGRKDAHGLVTGPVERLTVRDSEIHTFSGDGIQFDPSRAAPGWTDVRLERLKLWLEPLPSPVNGFAAGVVPGENAVDTKTPRSGRRSRLVVTQVEAWGFGKGLVTNMAAFNIKERVDASFDSVTVHHSDIAFRLRGPGDAGVSAIVRDSVLHHVAVGFRSEDDLSALRVERVTLGRDVATPFVSAGQASRGPDVRDLIVLGTRLPREANGRGRTVGPGAFVDVTADDYRLRP